MLAVDVVETPNEEVFPSLVTLQNMFLENRFRRDGQNSFEGKQGQAGVNRQKRTPSNRNGEQQENGQYVCFWY